MTGNRSLCAVLVVFLIIGAAPSAMAQSVYNVRNVASDDVLNMRAHVNSSDAVTSVPVVARIPWNAKQIVGTGNTAQVGSSTWVEVSYNGITGWVNGQFLLRVSDASGPPGTAHLKCGGAEPFWSLEVSDDKAVFKDPFAEGGRQVRRYRINNRTNARGRPQTFVAYMTATGEDRRAFATFIRTGQCSDGMSDNVYPYELLFVDRGHADGVWSGCCSTDR